MHKLTSSGVVSLWAVSALAVSGLAGCPGSAPAAGTSVGSAVTASSSTTTSQAIINGDLCGADVEPTAVALLADMTLFCPGFGSFDFTAVQCTGTLIAPDVVLLAAHCVDPEVVTLSTGCDVERSDFYISFEADLERLAAGDPAGGPQPIPASAIPAFAAVFDPAFDLRGLGNAGTSGGKEHDVALLFLDVAVEGVRPEVVITKEEATQLAEGTAVTIAGWGQQVATGQGEPSPAGSVGIKACGSSTIDELGPSLMQVGADPESTRKCHGDSGGPTYTEVASTSSIKRRVIGITSRAYDERDCALGGVDSRVDAYFDFINDEMTRACADGSRVWCDVPGVIPASFYDDEQPGEGEGEGNEGEGEDGNEGKGERGVADDDDVIVPTGCPTGCAATPVEIASALGLLALLRRRRPRST